MNLKKSSEDKEEPTITSDPPSQSNITAIDTPIVSIIGDDINRNFDERTSNAKYFQDSLLKRKIIRIFHMYLSVGILVELTGSDHYELKQNKPGTHHLLEVFSY